MNRLKLDNGLVIIFENKNSCSVAIEVMVKAGAYDETEKNSGVAHFIEHMLFEGTKKRSARELANEIDKTGGDINGYTSKEKTAYHIIVEKKHFSKALDVISDVIQNPLFDEKDIEKERKVILDEIKLVTDDPRFYQWILFERALFGKTPAGNPTSGTYDTIKNLKKKDLLEFYDSFYIPNNMIVSVSGNINPKIRKSVISAFRCMKKGNVSDKKERCIKRHKKSIKEKRKILSSYFILGYRTVNRTHKDSYALDLIRAILGKGQSGRLFYEIRTKRGLAYYFGVDHEPKKNYGFFSVFAGTDKKNIPLVKNLIIDEFKKLENLSGNEIKEAKDYIEGRFVLDNEDNNEMADLLAGWEAVKDARLAKSYISKIRKITKNKILRVAKKYLTKNYTTAIIEQK